MVRAASCVNVYPVSSGGLLRIPAWRRGLKVLILVLQKSVRSVQQRSAFHVISLFEGVPDHPQPLRESQVLHFEPILHAARLVGSQTRRLQSTHRVFFLESTIHAIVVFEEDCWEYSQFAGSFCRQVRKSAIPDNLYAGGCLF